MRYIDSHCHIHDRNFFAADSAEAVYQRARQASVGLICVGTDQEDSRAAVAFAASRADTWTVVGVHPHDTKGGVEDIGRLLSDGLVLAKIVGIGEIGLDYYYGHSPRQTQLAALEQQLQWAQDYRLPVSFHVREAFDDFWPVFDNFSGIRGVLHSFTDSRQHVERAFERDLYIGVNGISTFTKSVEQQAMFASLPLDRVLLETDAPFLTPVPLRGNINEPSYVVSVAEHIAAIKKLSLDEVAATTTSNTRRLFDI